MSSLDTSTGSWSEACATYDRQADIPATIRIALIDSTIVICDRRGILEFNTLKIRTTGSLSVSPLDALYVWRGVAAEELRNDPEHQLVLRWMEELNLNLWRADNNRLVAARGG